MDEKSDAAKELRSVMEAVAQAVVAREYARRPTLLAKYGERAEHGTSRTPDIISPTWPML